MNSSAPTRQPWLAVCLAVSAACASAVEPRMAVDPEHVARRPATADPCNAADLSGAMATLCVASSFDGDCVGFACARTESRTALECAVDAEDVATFAALSRAENPVTRVYAREALLRRGAMTMDVILDGLTDPAIVEHRSGCVVDSLAAAEPAFVALLLRDGPEADAWLAGFLESDIARRMLRNPWSYTYSRLLRPVLSLGTQSHRSAALRAVVSEIAVEADAALPRDWQPSVRAEALTPMPPTEVLTWWTRDHGCSSSLRARASKLLEAAETARLLQLERELAAAAAQDAAAARAP